MRPDSRTGPEPAGGEGAVDRARPPATARCRLLLAARRGSGMPCPCDALPLRGIVEEVGALGWIAVEVVELALVALSQVQLPAIVGDEDAVVDGLHAKRLLRVAAGPVDHDVVAFQRGVTPQHGHAALALEVAGQVCADQVEQGRHGVDVAVPAGDARLAVRQPGGAHEHGDPDRLLVEYGLLDDVVLAKLVAVLAAVDDDGVVRDSGILQRPQHRPHRPVDQGDHAPVAGDEGAPVLLAGRLGGSRRRIPGPPWTRPPSPGV